MLSCFQCEHYTLISYTGTRGNNLGYLTNQAAAAVCLIDVEQMGIVPEGFIRYVC